MNKLASFAKITSSSQFLEKMFKEDQELRNLFAKDMEDAGGWSQELVDKFIKKHRTKSNDVFGDEMRKEEFIKKEPTFDYSSFSNDDWNKYFILVMHMDNIPKMQYKALDIFEDKFGKFSPYHKNLLFRIARRMNLINAPEDYKISIDNIDDEAKKFGVNWEDIYSQVKGQSIGKSFGSIHMGSGLVSKNFYWQNMNKKIKTLKIALANLGIDDPELASDDSKEILGLVLNDDFNYRFLSDEEKALFGDLNEWGPLSNFLEKMGANITGLKRWDGSETEFFKVEIPEHGVYIIDSESPSFKDSDLKSWVQGIIDSGEADEWVRPIEPDIPSTVYHGTPDENVEDILVNGIECRSNSRGISNRGVGCAVFVSAEYSEADYYGVTLQIDIDGMERDGVLPRVSQEPDIEYYNACDAFASRFGLYLGDSVYYDIEVGMSPNTFILNGPVPPKYISVAEE